MIEAYDYFLFYVHDKLFYFGQAERNATRDVCISSGLNQEYDDFFLHNTHRKVNLSLWKKVGLHAFILNHFKKATYSHFLRVLDIINKQQENLNELYLNFLVKHSQMVVGSTKMLSQMKYKKKSIIIGGNSYGFDACWVNLSKKEEELSIKPTYEITNLLALLNI